MTSSGKTIKSTNAPAIWGVLIADALLAFFAVHGLESATALSAQAMALRAVSSVFAPVVALLLGNVVPVQVKDSLVFWRFRHVLPGHRAAEHARRDPRIDMARLERHIAAPFPQDPRGQNAFWYRLFKKVEGEPNVNQCNRGFLLLRELAAISFMAGLIAAILWVFFPVERPMLGVTGVVFGIQYLLSALGAASIGKRLVTTVLAAHAAKRRP